MMLAFLFGLFFLFHTLAISDGARLCGYPGRPVNGSSLSSGTFYQEGEKVRYRCNDGFVLSGDEERECQRNGTWSGAIPTCGFNLAQGKTALQSNTLWNYKPGLALDGNPDTCSFTPREESRWFQASLGRRYNVDRVSVAISVGSEQEFTIYIIELMDNNKALYKPCATFSGVFQTLYTEFICNDGLGHPGHFVYIRDDRRREHYLGLCEVQVFAHRDRIPCGDPERSPYSKVLVSEDGSRAEYQCDSGYRPTGDTTRQCMADGSWTGYPPYCIAVECESPPSILHGTYEAQPNEDEVYQYGTTATYKCDDGYVAWGNTTLTCLDDSKWTDPPPQCRAIRCSEPPAFPHTVVGLRDGNTHWKSVAIYSCAHGYSFHNDTKEINTVCESTGSWRSINITCVPDIQLQKLDTHTTETMASETDTIPIVVAVVVIGLLVIVVAIAMLFVYIRKRRTQQEKPLKASIERKVSSLDTKPSATIISSSIKPLSSDAPVPPMRSKHSYTNSSPLPPKPDISDKVERIENEHTISNSTLSTVDDDPDYDKIPQDEEEPPYERIKNHEPNYEKIGESKDEPNISESGYEKIGNADEYGYEKIKNRLDAGYETIRKMSENDPNYETIEGGQNNMEEPDYEVIHPRKESIGQSSLSGYEVIRPKRRHSSKRVPPQVPDILKEITVTSPTTPEVEEGLSKDIKARTWSKEIPPEILALYAKVDKTKKTKYRSDLTQSNENLAEAEVVDNLSGKSHTCPVRLGKETISKRDSLHNLNFSSGGVPVKVAGDGTPYLLSSSSSLDSEEVSSDGRTSSCSSTPHTSFSADSGHFSSISPVTPPVSPLRPLPPIPSEPDIASL